MQAATAASKISPSREVQTKGSFPLSYGVHRDSGFFCCYFIYFILFRLNNNISVKDGITFTMRKQVQLQVC